MPNMDDLLGSLDEQGKQKQQQDEKVAQSAENAQNADKVAGAVDKNTQSTANGLKNIEGDVTVTNPDLAKTDDVNKAVEAINKLNLTTFMQNEGLPQLANNLSDLSSKTQDLQERLESEGLKKVSDQLGLVVKKLDEVSKVLTKTEVSIDAKLQKTIDNLSKSIGAIDFKPSVNVSAPIPKVVTTPVDLKSVLGALASVEQAIKDSETPETELDLSAVTAGLSAVQKAITSLRFPVPNYVLPFKSVDGKAAQLGLDASGNIVGTGDGTTVGSVVAGDSGQNAQIIVGARKEVTFTTTTAQAVASTDTSNYSYASVHITSQGGSSTVTFQVSNDNTNWVSTTLLSASANGGGITSSTLAAVVYYGPITGRYFRLNVTGIVSGTTAGVVEFFANAKAQHSANITAAQSGTWSVGANSATGSAVPANAFYAGINDGTNLQGMIATKNGLNSASLGILAAGMVAQLDDTSPTVITENQFGNLRIDTARQLRVNNQSAPDATLLNTYSVHLTTNTTTTPTSSTAYVSAISISSEVAGTTSTVTIQDKQGTPLKLINGLSTTSLTTTPTTVNFQTPVKMVSGIDILTAGAVAATVDVWVNYYQQEGRNNIMAFTATLSTITPQADGTGVGINWLVTVTFADSATGFSSIKTYSFPMGTTQAAAQAAITADGNNLKGALASASTLASKVGTILTI